MSNELHPYCTCYTAKILNNTDYKLESHLHMSQCVLYC